MGYPVVEEMFLVGSLQEAMKELDAELAVEPNNFFASYWKVKKIVFLFNHLF